MTLDYEAEDSIKLGKDLKAGDCIRDSKGNPRTGVIIGVNHLEEFYESRPHFEYHDINDCTHSYSTRLNLEEEFTVINSRKEILRYYNVVELDLLRESADCLDRRRGLMKVRAKAIDRLNNKLDELNKLNKLNKDK